MKHSEDVIIHEDELGTLTRGLIVDLAEGVLNTSVPFDQISQKADRISKLSYEAHVRTQRGRGRQMQFQS
jgi:hypothetical protein